MHSFKGESNSTFLVLLDASKEECIYKEEAVFFLVANQRHALYSEYNMRPMNQTLNVSVIIKCVNHEKGLARNAHLMRFLHLEWVFCSVGFKMIHFLLLFRTTFGNKQFFHSRLVRRDKYFYQTAGVTSLNSLLSNYSGNVIFLFIVFFNPVNPIIKPLFLCLFYIVQNGFRIYGDHQSSITF